MKIEAVSNQITKKTYLNHYLQKTDSPMALEKQLRYMQILQVITLVFLLMLAAAVIYLLMLQICGEAGCFGQGGVNANDDYFACKKTQRNL